MSTKDFSQLQKLAGLNGVQTSYLDMGGRQQAASPEVLKAVLHALDVPAGSDREIRDSLQESSTRQWQRITEPVAVAKAGERARIQLRIPEQDAAKPLSAVLRLENGRERSYSPERADLSRPKAAADVDGKKYLAQTLTLPALPIGYHELQVAIGRHSSRTLLLAAPAQAYSAPGSKKKWGVFLPMYAAHSQDSWGAGNFRDWQKLTQWTASLGGSVTASLPLLAAFLDCPICEPSPYSPASRLFWNPFYLDLTHIPEFLQCAPAQKLVASSVFQQRLREFRESPLVDYQAQWAARREVLELLAEFFFSKKSPRRALFQRFVESRPEAADYASFRAVCERRRTSWHNWPERLQNGNLRPGDFDERVQRFHLYTQWLAQEQMEQLLKASRRAGVRLYLDLPLGVNPDGYDAWRERESFALGASAGAPPDTFFTKGQNWGFPPLHPQRIRGNGYGYVLDFLRFQMRHTGLLRIDHVMGLHRLYWVPRGLPATHGAYVTYPAEELHAILAIESHRHKTVIVGENLGTVPPEVNESMKRNGLREMYVVQYEQRPGRNPLRNPPQRCVASLNTHDMPTFPAHWQGLDIEDRADLGLIPKPKLPKERAARKQMNQDLVAFLRREGLLKTRSPDLPQVMAACLKWLGRSSAEMILVNLEDLLLEEKPQNVPGTSTERPNWRRKAKCAFEAIRENLAIADLLQTLRRSRRKP